MKIPERWLAYSALGKCIPGTRFICFKVPLKDALCRNLEVHERFTPKMLMEQCPKLGMVIDLTNTSRYYNGEAFKDKGIQYKKLMCPGQVIPPLDILQEFFKAVDAFIRETEEDKLIGVHCTHGLNRTGYFVCRYLNLRMGYAAQDAISAFENARGYKIERQPFIEDIVSGKEIAHVSNENPIAPISSEEPLVQNATKQNHKDRFEPKNNRRNGYYESHSYPEIHFPPPQVPQYTRNCMNYQSPLAGCSYDNYEVSNRYSRGYGNPRSGRGSHQGYQNNRNHPYARPSGNSDERWESFKEETGRRNKTRWDREDGMEKRSSKGKHSER